MLTSSTGTNDPTSAWGSGLLNTITGITNAASGVIGAVKGNNPKADQPSQKGNGAGVGLAQYLPWILGGGAVLLVVFFVLKKR